MRVMGAAVAGLTALATAAFVTLPLSNAQAQPIPSLADLLAGPEPAGETRRSRCDQSGVFFVDFVSNATGNVISSLQTSTPCTFVAVFAPDVNQNNTIMYGSNLVRSRVSQSQLANERRFLSQGCDIGTLAGTSVNLADIGSGAEFGFFGGGTLFDDHDVSGGFHDFYFGLGGGFDFNDDISVGTRINYQQVETDSGDFQTGSKTQGIGGGGSLCFTPPALQGRAPSQPGTGPGLQFQQMQLETAFGFSFNETDIKIINQEATMDSFSFGLGLNARQTIDAGPFDIDAFIGAYYFHILYYGFDIGPVNFNDTGNFATGVQSGVKVRYPMYLGESMFTPFLGVNAVGEVTDIYDVAGVRDGHETYFLGGFDLGADLQVTNNAGFGVSAGADFDSQETTAIRGDFGAWFFF